MNNPEVVLRISQRLHEAWEANGIEHWLHYGAVLGGVRSDALIPYDTDIDWGVKEEDHLRAASIASAFGPCGRYGKHVIQIRPDNGGLIEIKACRKVGSNYIDLSQRGKYWKAMCWDGSEPVTVNDCTLPGPRHPHLYLEGIYGKDWRVPKRWIATNWERSDSVNQGDVPEKITGFISGTWDLFHVGHLRMIGKARELFDDIVIGVMPDAEAMKYKRLPIIPYAQRREIVSSFGPVVESDEGITVELLDEHNCHYALYGPETPEAAEDRFPGVTAVGRLHITKRTHDTSTTEIIARTHDYSAVETMETKGYSDPDDGE